MNISRLTILLTLSFLVGIVASNEFVKGAYLHIYWISIAILLVVTILVLWRMKPQVHPFAYWGGAVLASFGCSAIAMLLAIVISDTGKVDNLVGAANDDPWGVFGVATVEIAYSIVHFGWLPFLVAIGLARTLKRQ